MATNGQRLLHKRMRQVLLAMALCSICLLLNSLRSATGFACSSPSHHRFNTHLWDHCTINLASFKYHPFGQCQTQSFQKVVSSIWPAPSVIHLASVKYHPFGRLQTAFILPESTSPFHATGNYFHWRLCQLSSMTPLSIVIVDAYTECCR